MYVYMYICIYIYRLSPSFKNCPFSNANYALLYLRLLYRTHTTWGATYPAASPVPSGRVSRAALGSTVAG